MQVRNNEIIVRRGETFTVSKLIQNRDGAPYIISSELSNPYWLFTVSSLRYDQKDRYILNKWLDLKDFFRFKHTQPIELSRYGLKFTDNTLPFIDLDGDGEDDDFTGDETSGYANIAIFYEKDSEGVTHYKYWEYINNIEGDYSGQWVEYKCPLITLFSNSVTSNWIEQNYYYQIKLVSGISLTEYLIDLAKTLNINVDEFSNDFYFNEILYRKIYEIDKLLLDGIDTSKPLVSIDVDYPILNPTKLYVTSNLNGGVL